MSRAGLGGRASVAEPSAPAAAPAAAAASAAAAIPAPEFTDDKIPNIRRVIARTMHASLTEMAQLSYTSSFDATVILNYRARIKAESERLGLANITLNDIVLYAVSRTLMNPANRDLNAHF